MSDTIRKALTRLDAELERWIEMGDTRPIAGDTDLTTGDLRMFRAALSTPSDAGIEAAGKDAAERAENLAKRLTKIIAKLDVLYAKQQTQSRLQYFDDPGVTAETLRECRETIRSLSPASPAPSGHATNPRP